MKFGESFATLVIVSALAALIWNVIRSIGIDAGIQKMQKEAVEKGFAYYNPTNAAWQWKDNK